MTRGFGIMADLGFRGLTFIRRPGCFRAVFFLIGAGCWVAAGSAGPPPSERLTVQAAVALARTNYPRLRAASARVDASRGGVNLAHVAYRPRTDLYLQENRGTRNNLSSLLLPQFVLPQISGAVLPGASDVARWNSGVGALITWEPFDFGLRKAHMDVARGERAQAERRLDLTRLDVSVGAADAFLIAFAAAENARAVQANVARLEAFTRVVRTLVANQLRAGADEARSEAELARARTQSIQAHSAAELSRAALGEAIGAGGALPELASGPLLCLPEVKSITETDVLHTPQVEAQVAAVETARARERAVDASAKPRFNLLASLSTRGSGFQADGRPDPDAGRGILPTTDNWAAGLSITYNLSELSERKARRRIERGNSQAERARLEETVQAQKTARTKARLTLKAAVATAANTPLELSSARQASELTRVRFQEGLATVSDVAEAEALLTRAEVDDAVARLSVWRALLGVAHVQGNLDAWLARVEAKEGEQ